jgi:endonuclease-3
MTTNASTILTILKKSYPTAHVALTFSTPWELLVAVELAAQCTDLRVNKVTVTLFKKYPTLDRYLSADVKTFEQDIKSTGFYHNKAKNILGAARIIKEKFGGRVPNTMGDILTIPGVARKTANVVLGNAYRVVEGIAVDTHMIRLSQRLRLVDLDRIGGKNVRTFTKNPSAGSGQAKVVVDFKKDADPVKIERELMKILPRKEWLSTTYRIVEHGRAVCKSQNPKCAECILHKYCPASRNVV